MYNKNGDEMKKIWTFLVFTCLVASLSGCRVQLSKVCGTNYPVVYLIERIGGDYVEACNLSENELIQVADIRKTYKQDIEDADVVFMINGLEPYYPVYQDEFEKSSTKLVDLSHTSAVYQFQRYTSSRIDGQEVVVEGKYYDDASFNKVDQYEKDLILWIDPISMMSMASDIADTLSKLYPENAKDFENRYKELEIELAKLDAEFQNLGKENKNIRFVSMTPSFGNWQKSYGFDVYPVILSKYGALPTAKQKKAIIKRIKDDKVKYIAKEENLTDEMKELYDEIKKECNLTEITLYNLSSISEKDVSNNKNYMSLMYENLAQLEGMK